MFISSVTHFRRTYKFFAPWLIMPLTMTIAHAQELAQPTPSSATSSAADAPTVVAATPAPEAAPSGTSVPEGELAPATEAAPAPGPDANAPSPEAAATSGATPSSVPSSEPPSASHSGDVHDTTPTETGDGERKSNFQPRLSVVLGYASPSGSLLEGEGITSTQTAAIPLGLDFQLMGASGFAWGIYLQFTPGFAGKDLDDCVDCLTYGGRIGLQAGQHFAQRSFVDPWITFGIGYEFLSVSQDTTVLTDTSSGGVAVLDGSITTSASALPELMLQVGLDFGDKLRVGPYAFASWGMYGNLNTKLTCDDDACAREVISEVDRNIAFDDRSSHYWVGGGLRASLNN